MKNLPESLLFPPVRLWLERAGFAVFAEMWGHDVVAHNGTRIVVVELKTSLTRGLCWQCRRAATFADQVYAAVPTAPRPPSLALCIEYELGVLRVIGQNVEEVMSPPWRNRVCWEPERLKTLEALKCWKPPAEQVAGVPTLAGSGDAQRVCRLIAEYRSTNPKATWRDVFRDVPNHYAHHKSMQQAMGSVRDREIRRLHRAQ